MSFSQLLTLLMLLARAADPKVRYEDTSHVKATGASHPPTYTQGATRDNNPKPLNPEPLHP